MLRHALPLACLFLAAPVLADDNLPPFDFSDQFYLANGIDPSTLIGRPDGTPPGSVIDDRENGADFNNVRLLDTAAAYDGSGHPIFFNVTGLPTLASFTDNEAGQEALQIAEEFNVYEFPRADNPPFSVFPKRQDLVADLSGGYFSNDPLGIWRINLVRYTDAAFNTQDGQEALAELEANNGVDLDGTPLIRTLGEIEHLSEDGFVTIQVPAMDGSEGFRWFFCPVIEDPKDGAIAPDAFLTVTDGPAAQEFIDLFNCLQQTGDDHCDLPPCVADITGDGTLDLFDFLAFVNLFNIGDNKADLNGDGALDLFDFLAFSNLFNAGC